MRVKPRIICRKVQGGWLLAIATQYREKYGSRVHLMEDIKVLIRVFVLTCFRTVSFRRG